VLSSFAFSLLDPNSHFICENKKRKHPLTEGRAHGIFNYIDTKAKCLHIKKFTSKRDFAAVVYLSEAPSPPMAPYPSLPLHTVYVHTVLIHTGKGEEGRGGGELTREKVGGTTVHKAGSKIPI
jgi:hypothetical protein